VEVTLVVVDQILKTKKKKKILNKLMLEILAVVQVVAVELTQVAELILNQELDKVLVDLEMVKDQDKVQDKV
jgi:hypothetical protein